MGGCGVPGLMVATSSQSLRPRKVYMTDLNPQTVENLQHNIELNEVQDFVRSSCMDWSDKATWPEEKFLYVCPVSGRDGLDAFVESMKNQCPGWVEKQAPQDYHANPLTNDDDEECFLH